MFSHISEYLEARQNYSAVGRIRGQTWSFVFDMLLNHLLHILH